VIFAVILVATVALSACFIYVNVQIILYIAAVYGYA